MQHRPLYIRIGVVLILFGGIAILLTGTRHAVPATIVQPATTSEPAIEIVVPSVPSVTSYQHSPPGHRSPPVVTGEVAPSQSRTDTLPVSARQALPAKTPAAPATRTGRVIAAPTPCARDFTDVPRAIGFYVFVHDLLCRGIISGYGEGTFRPSSNITRGQAAKIVALAGAYGAPIATTHQSFTDVPVGYLMWLPIERIAQQDVIHGYTCGEPGEPCIPPFDSPYFRPDVAILRGQFAQMVAQAAGFADTPTKQIFEDVPPDHPAYRWIEQIGRRGIISGYECGGPGEPCIFPENRPYFRPSNPVTRGQTAKIVAGAFFPEDQTPVQADSILWSDGLESGDFSQWLGPGGQGDAGGIYNSGNGVASITSTIVHSGNFSAQMNITIPSKGVTEAVRIFRWKEAQQEPDLYYSAWFYMPRLYQPICCPSWWNIFQWKSTHPATPDPSLSDPTWIINIGNRPSGEMYLYLWDAIGSTGYEQQMMNVPIGRWFHVEAFMSRAPDRTGRMGVWQDGWELFDIGTVQTSYSTDNRWSLDNYSDGIVPGDVTIYVDDAVISRQRIGP